MAKVEVAEMQSSVHEKDKNVLEFMDSTDSYLVLMNSLSSSLRQGWFELASARHSMGASRINSALFDLKYHSAATTLQLNNLDAGPELEKLHFSLCKWASSESPKSSSEEAKFEEDKLLQRKSSSPKVLKQDGSSNSAPDLLVPWKSSLRNASSTLTAKDNSRKKCQKLLNHHVRLMIKLEKSGSSHYPCLGCWSLPSFELPNCHLRQLWKLS
uniref:Vacuolar ATPase assembly protein VMA22 n=2 Tax=Nicotiana sylvestris TaxID=4096 RepID=A0A1U7XEB9_NICSY|nr:PREDICTED: uncharacterized protein LOC104233588 isoform X4 [Nicotiana sylvestris]